MKKPSQTVEIIETEILDKWEKIGFLFDVKYKSDVATAFETVSEWNKNNLHDYVSDFETLIFHKVNNHFLFPQSYILLIPRSVII